MGRHFLASIFIVISTLLWVIPYMLTVIYGANLEPIQTMNEDQFERLLGIMRVEMFQTGAIIALVMGILMLLWAEFNALRNKG
ncbi:hypothetical protein DH09_11515 [Bacillaceae bacterium JMAK1]|nr:hypothetical protein DH09_11515 [Bacillaceae bacterium JMAK1]